MKISPSGRWKLRILYVIFSCFHLRRTGLRKNTMNNSTLLHETTSSPLGAHTTVRAPRVPRRMSMANIFRGALARWIFACLTLATPWCLVEADEACRAQAPTLERTLCEQPALRLLKDSLARKFDRWQQYCKEDAYRPAAKLLPHAAWLEELRASFDRLEGVAPRDFLGSTFTQRADELAEVLASCARDFAPEVRELHIETVRLSPAEGQDEADTMLFVRTEPPLIGLRINDALFGEAPASPREDDIRKAFASFQVPSTENAGIKVTLNVSVLWRNPRVLVLQMDTSGCEARCWQNSEQRLFDLRTGDSVNADDLLSATGRGRLDRLGERKVLKEADKLRQRDAASWEEDGRDTFERCISEWQGWRRRGGEQIVWLTNGRWLVRGPACAGDGDAMPPTIDSKDYPLAALSPYLSAYGRSLLLGQGNVRTPEPQQATCTVASLPSDPLGWAARVAEISAGADHVFLRETSGRVWAWGINFHGELGKRTEGDGSWIAPFVFGDEYTYAGAGQTFSVAVKRDGSLWTWGSGYRNRLGDAAPSRLHPAIIGQGFAFADVDNYGGRALTQDGKLYAWGSDWPSRFQIMARDVAQVSGSKPILVLHRNGELRAWNEWHWPQRITPAMPDVLNWHGTGFTRLAKARNLDLAWRADGSTWAWANTLTGMISPEELPGLGETPWPRLVGREWVDVKQGDTSLVAARKADGSLWVSRWRGKKMRMEPLGCGFVDMAFARDETYGTHLLALRSDGQLLDYHGDRRNAAEPRRELFDFNPEVVAVGGVRLFDENGYWGSYYPKIFLLRQDGTLSQWYACINTRDCDNGDAGSDKRMRKIDFPATWFEKPSLAP